MTNLGVVEDSEVDDTKAKARGWRDDGRGFLGDGRGPLRSDFRNRTFPIDRPRGGYNLSRIGEREPSNRGSGMVGGGGHGNLGSGMMGGAGHGNMGSRMREGGSHGNMGSRMMGGSQLGSQHRGSERF